MVLWPLDPNFPFPPPYPLIDRLFFLFLSLTGLRRATVLRFQSWSKLKDLSNLPWHLSLNFFEFFSMLLLQENVLILIRVLRSNFYFWFQLLNFVFKRSSDFSRGSSASGISSEMALSISLSDLGFIIFGLDSKAGFSGDWDAFSWSY